MAGSLGNARIWWLLSGGALLAVVLFIGLHRPAEPSTRIYTIGTDNTFPYHYLDSNGKPGGMIADVLQEAARRSGVRLQWEFRPAGPLAALREQAADLWPLVNVNYREYGFHTTKPFFRNAYVLLSPDPKQPHLRFVSPGEDDHIRRVAIVGFPIARSLASRFFPHAAIVARPTRELAFLALCAGEADAFLTEARTAQYLALQRPKGCEQITLHSSGLDVDGTDLSIASQPAAAAVADLLRTEIDAMVADGTMASLLRPWNYYYSGEADTMFRENEANAARRISVLLAAALALLSVLLLILLARVRRAQQLAVSANAAKSQFLANMSHEIRTPLNGMLGVGQLLSESPLDPRQRDYVDMLLGSGRVLLTLVNDLLDLARIERGHLELQLVVFTPSTLFSDILKVYELQASAKGITFTWHGLECLPPLLRGDAARIRQVLANLIANAVKFTSAGGVTITFRHTSTGNQVLLEIEVADTGIGMSDKSRARLFEKFYQADASISSRFGGTGLGLAIVRELVHAMSGSISVSSVEGAGSTFCLSLPLALADLPREASLPVGPPAAFTAPSSPLSILLVEDNLVNQRIALRFLERDGHRVTSVPDGSLALEAFDRQRFDLILMDCQMPVLDGFAATAGIRRREAGAFHTPIIALTAAAMRGDRERCLAAGMDDYLAKPLDLRELRHILEKWSADRPSAGDQPGINDLGRDQRKVELPSSTGTESGSIPHP